MINAVTEYQTDLRELSNISPTWRLLTTLLFTTNFLLLSTYNHYHLSLHVNQPSTTAKQQKHYNTTTLCFKHALRSEESHTKKKNLENFATEKKLKNTQKRQLSQVRCGAGLCSMICVGISALLASPLFSELGLFHLVDGVSWLSLNLLLYITRYPFSRFAARASGRAAKPFSSRSSTTFPRVYPREKGLESFVLIRHFYLFSQALCAIWTQIFIYRQGRKQAGRRTG